jgi:serine/threonine protein kinase
MDGPLRYRPLIVALTLVVSAGWFVYLQLAPQVNAGYEIGRFQVLVSWGNVALMPVLGFAALAAYLATGNRPAAALAWASLAFAAVFPLHRLFTADYNPINSFLFYGTLSRLAFAAFFLVLSDNRPPDSTRKRRRRLIGIIAATGTLAIVRFVLKGPLDSLAEELGERGPISAVEWCRKGVEAVTAVLAAAVAWRLFQQHRRQGVVSDLLGFAFVLTAEQSLLFFVSNAQDLYWWGANVFWAIANSLLIIAVFAIVTEPRRGLTDAAGAVAQPEIGALIAGYEIIRPIGAGGMGQVFLARKRRLNRLVALKVIRQEQGSDPRALLRFHREALASARLSHPNIVELYDAVEADDLHFLVMEYVEGADLEQLLDRHGALPPSLACDYIRQACDGLQHAHDRGLIHRDIKPGNLLVTADGKTVKLLDMGVARLTETAGEGTPEHQLTQTGAVMGTPAYLAPEQARDPRHVDIRADIYSLGCAFYHLLSGKVPFEGVTLAEVVLRHQMEEPVPLTELRPDIPPELQNIVQKMMAKRPEDRYQTPKQVANALSSIVIVGGEGYGEWRAQQRRPDGSSTDGAGDAERTPVDTGSYLWTTPDVEDASLMWYGISIAMGVGIMALLGYVLIRALF